MRQAKWALVGALCMVLMVAVGAGTAYVTSAGLRARVEALEEWRGEVMRGMDEALARIDERTPMSMHAQRAVEEVLALGEQEGDKPQDVARGEVQDYTVTRVLDGDTIEVREPGGILIRVRLRRVNAPELGEPGGEAARAALAQRLLGKRVHVRPFARDVYGRVIAEVEPR